MVVVVAGDGGWVVLASGVEECTGAVKAGQVDQIVMLGIKGIWSQGITES